MYAVVGPPISMLIYPTGFFYLYSLEKLKCQSREQQQNGNLPVAGNTNRDDTLEKDLQPRTLSPSQVLTHLLFQVPLSLVCHTQELFQTLM